MIKPDHLNQSRSLAWIAYVFLLVCRGMAGQVIPNKITRVVKEHMADDPITLQLLTQIFGSTPSPALRTYLHLSLNRAVILNEVVSSMTSDDGTKV